MRQKFAAAAVLFALVSAAHAAGEPQQDGPPDRGIVAILRRDGVILPFAAFNGNTWSTPWPAGLRLRDLPVNVESVRDEWWGGRKPDAWRAWLAEGGSVPLEVQSPAVFTTHCDKRLGLRTNYQSKTPLPPVAVLPFPKDGLAVAGGAQVDPIEIVDRAAPEWSPLAVALMSEFDRAEDREISAARSGEGWRHPVRPETRKSIPVRIESWYRTPLDEAGATVSWIEAVRSYPPGPDDEDCGLETMFAGWVYHDKPDARPRAEITARLMYCDRVGAAYMLPLGKIRVRQSAYWIYQLSGYDAEWYTVAELSRPKVKFAAGYPAGKCR